MSEQIFIGNVSLKDFLIFILFFVIVLVISNIISEILKNYLKRRIRNSMYKLIPRLIQYSILFFSTYYGLSNILKFDLTAFFAAFGIMGIVVAFSAQQTIQNLIAGLFVFFQGMIKLDDWVELPGLPTTGLCQVKDIGLTRTTLRDYNGSLVYIPNSMFITNKIIKYPNGDFFRVKFDLKVSSKSKLSEVVKTVVDICNKNEKVLPNIPNKEKTGLKKIIEELRGEQILSIEFLEKKIDPNRFEPRVYLKEITKDTITIEVEIWIWEIQNKNKIISDLMTQFITEFPRKGINLA
ncbi:MAG: mechanosensitive ion channel [Candidatus Aenigmatarchaeota archaeon]